MGLSIEGSERGADVYVRVPSNKESIFRAAVVRDSLQVSDVLQVWLTPQHIPRADKSKQTRFGAVS